MRREIPPQQRWERCIVALDVPTKREALALVKKLGDAAGFYKIGLELFAGGVGRALLGTLVRRGLKVFADLKLYDVPATVARATRQIATSGAHFLTVHGDDAIMRAAVENKGNDLKILAVTALTSLDKKALRQLGYGGSMRDFVLERARQAQRAGCDGVVCSGWEVADLRAALGEEFILVTPGVRRAEQTADDQKRTATPSAVIAEGGDYLVVGRPIRDASSPSEALWQIILEIEQYPYHPSTTGQRWEVFPSLAKWLATQQTIAGQPQRVKKIKTAENNLGVFRAAGIEAATPSQQKFSQRLLIEDNEPNHQAAYNGIN